MSLGLSAINQFNWFTDNWTATPICETHGTAITPGISDAEGSWTQILGALANDCWLMSLIFSGGNVTVADKPHLADIGIDPAGGTTYTAIIDNLTVSDLPTLEDAIAMKYRFPFFIPAGSTVACRIQGGDSVATTVRCSVRVFGKPSRPEVAFLGQYCQTLGTITGSKGVSFTPGNVAWGSYVSLGTTAKRSQWFQFAMAVGNTAKGAEDTYIEFSYGDATNKHVMAIFQYRGSTNEQLELVINPNVDELPFYDLPSGTELFVRGFCDSPPDSGYYALAYAVGG